MASKSVSKHFLDILFQIEMELKYDGKISLKFLVNEVEDVLHVK